MSSSKSWGGSGIFEIRFATIVLVFEFSKAEKQCSKASQLECADAARRGLAGAAAAYTAEKERKFAKMIFFTKQSCFCKV